MRSILLAFLILLFAQGQAQDIATLSREAVQLEQQFREAAALEKLGAILRQEPADYFALWKSSELYSRLGAGQPKTQGQMNYYKKARQLAAQAIKVNPNGAEGFYVMSVAMGRLALTGPNKEKIAAVKAIKANAEQALKLNPQYGRAWHVLGKWHLEVSGLNLVERTAVKVFYGGFPESSLQAAIQAFEKAQRLEPNFALNHLELARAYHRSGQDAKAKALLQRLAALPNKTGDDNRVKAEGRALLEDLD